MIAAVFAAYNEAHRIGDVLARVPDTIHGDGVAAIVVCDGSTDGTCVAAARAGAIVVALRQNHGKWYAVRRGLEAAREIGATTIVLIDSDGQHDPEAMVALVEPVASGAADLSIGSRYLEDPGQGSAPRNRYLVRRSTIALLERLIGRRYTDPYSGYRCLAAGVLAQMRLAGDRYQGELECIFEAHRLGLSVVEVPVAKVYGSGTSKMGAFHGRLVGRLSVLAQYSQVFVRYAPPNRRRVEPSEGGAQLRDHAVA
jgi:dolichol-phosphate mannosyltransferase